jgi:hypothetical protein
MTEGRLVAIHQPNFFPWLGYFAKLRRADVFIVMDNAQFPKTGGNWSNRVRIAMQDQARWLTVPVVRAYHGTRTCAEMAIDDAHPWRPQLLKTLRTYYSRAPFFARVFPVVEGLLENPTDRLAEFNVGAIRALAAAVQLDAAKMILGTTLPCDGKATDLLVSMVRAVGGTGYLCGGGAGGYQEDDKFAAAGLDLVYQHFRHPIYSQSNAREFLPGLSIVDALMNCGFEGTSRLLAGEVDPGGTR